MHYSLLMLLLSLFLSFKFWLKKMTILQKEKKAEQNKAKEKSSNNNKNRAGYEPMEIAITCLNTLFVSLKKQLRNKTIHFV